MSNLLRDNKELMKEYDYEKNNNITLENLVVGSGKKAWWRCSKCGGSWQTYIVNKFNGSKCPYCSNRKVLCGFNDLETRYPEIAKEWNYERNGNLLPSDVVYGSNRRVWWKCSNCNYEWEATIVSRTNIGNGCRNCAINTVGNKIKKKKIERYGNLVETHSKIAKEWNYEKNGDLKPENFHLGSTEKVWWKCPPGHEYEQVISARTKDNYNCSICANESHSSFPEQVIYYYLSKYLSKYSVYNRYIIDSFEADIFVEKLKLAIEYDGFYYHNNSNTRSRENKKNKYFKNNGIKLIRVKENSKKDYFYVNENDVISINKDPSNLELNIMVEKLLNRISELYKIKLNPVINIEKDRIAIMDSYIFNIKKNSLASKFPKLTNEWNYDKNGTINPMNVIYNKDKKFWWKCINCGFEWNANLRNRTIKNIGCPKCGIKKQLISFNKNQVLRKGSLLQNNPSLAKEWNYEKNGELTPDDIISTSNKRVWWKCSNGHEWEASICKRNNGTGCPYCSNRKVLKGYNDLETKFPQIAKEWNYERNGKLEPSQVIYGSYKKVWWKCPKGHEWEAVISYRTMGYDNCLICKKLKKSNMR